MTIYSSLMTYENPKIMNASPERNKIDIILIHHNATTNEEIAMNTWSVANGKNTSAHYEITDNQIIGCVPEDMTAWHAGDWGVNLRSIGIEHVNSTGAPEWLVSDETLKQSARLIVDICKRYNLPIDSTTIQPHKKYQATQCPGGLDINKLIKMAQDLSGDAPIVTLPKDSTPEKVLSAIDQFKAVKGDFVITSKFNVTSVSLYNGIYQLLSSDLGGDSYHYNGIPLDIIYFVDGSGNELPNQVYDGSQKYFKFYEDYSHGTIDYYDTPTNAVGINTGDYGTIWYNADKWLTS